MITVYQRHNIAKNLKYLRVKNGLTQKAFSDKVGINKNTYGMFECYGEGIGPERLKRIYDFYKINEETALMEHEEFVKKVNV